MPTLELAGDSLASFKFNDADGGPLSFKLKT
jgi:hypothetical protein